MTLSTCFNLLPHIASSVSGSCKKKLHFTQPGHLRAKYKSQEFCIVWTKIILHRQRKWVRSGSGKEVRASLGEDDGQKAKSRKVGTRPGREMGGASLGVGGDRLVARVG